MGTISRYYSNVAIDNTLGVPGGISSSATTLYTTTAPSGYPQQYPFTLEVDIGNNSAELMNIVGGSGTNAAPWIVGTSTAGGGTPSVAGRGWDGTLAVSHAQGASVGHRSSAEDFQLSRNHEASDSTSAPNYPHGLPATAWQQGAVAIINETKLTNSASSVVSWSSIPQIYAHLLVIVQARGTATGSQDIEAVATINGDTGAKYSYFSQALSTETGSLVSSADIHYGQTAWNDFITLAASQAGASVNAGGGFMLLPNYAGTSLNKMAVGISGFGNGTSSAGKAVARWCFYNPASQAAITSLALAASSGNYQSGSFFGIYGLG